MKQLIHNYKVQAIISCLIRLVGWFTISFWKVLKTSKNISIAIQQRTSHKCKMLVRLYIECEWWFVVSHCTQNIDRTKTISFVFIFATIRIRLGAWWCTWAWKLSRSCESIGAWVWTSNHLKFLASQKELPHSQEMTFGNKWCGRKTLCWSSKGKGEWSQPQGWQRYIRSSHN